MDHKLHTGGITHMDIEPIAEFTEDEPRFTLLCGCKGYITWYMDLTWDMCTVLCDGHVHIPDLPKGTILIR